jgi:hypothetical protein
MQTTLNVDGEKVRIRTQRATNQGNHKGWYVWINGVRHIRYMLSEGAAMDSVYAKWVQCRESSQTTT